MIQQINLKNLDKQPAKFSLTFDSVREHKSRIGGALTLCYLILVVFFLFFKTLDLLNRDQITFSMFIQKSQDLTELNISSSNITMVFFRTVSKLENFGLSRQRVMHSQQMKYGINVSIQQYTIWFDVDQEGRRIQSYTQERLPMIPCTPDPNCTLFCMPKPSNSKFQYNVLGRTDFSAPLNTKGKVFRKYTILVELCDKKINLQCQNFKNQNMIYPYLVFYNNQIQPENIKHQQAIKFNSSERAFQVDYLQNQEQIQFKFMVKKAVVETVNSIWPDFMPFLVDSLTTETWFYDEEKTERTVLKNFDKTLLAMEIRRSVYTHIYTRKCKKIDQMLGQVFGMMGLLSAIFFGLYAGYNNWSFEQNIRKSFGLHYTQPSLLNFYKHVIRRAAYKLCGCFCKNNQVIQKQIEAQQQITEILDMKKLIQQLKNRKQPQLNKNERSEASSILNQKEESQQTNQIKQIIRECYDEGQQKLDLSTLFARDGLAEDWKRVLMFRNWTALQTLDLSFCRIGDGTQSVVNLPWPNLLSLNMRNIKISVVGVRNLVGKNFPKLVEFSVQDNNIEDEGMRSLLTAMHLSLLRILNVGNNNISHLGMSMMPSLKMNQLKNIILRYNSIGSTGIKLLIKADISMLQLLDLSNCNCQLGNEGAKFLAKADWPCLLTLYLVENKMKFDGCSAITVANWKTLKTSFVSLPWDVDKADPLAALSLVATNWSQKLMVYCFPDETFRQDTNNILNTRFIKA